MDVDGVHPLGKSGHILLPKCSWQVKMAFNDTPQVRREGGRAQAGRQAQLSAPVNRSITEGGGPLMPTRSCWCVSVCGGRVGGWVGASRG